jgi:hypothetical protein
MSCNSCHTKQKERMSLRITKFNICIVRIGLISSLPLLKALNVITYSLF